MATLLALGLRLALGPLQVRSDSRRFLNQANQLLQGGGFGEHGVLQAHLPPGYPLFIAAVYSVSPSLRSLAHVQVLISVATCVLVYLALRTARSKWAVFTLFALACSPTLIFHSQRIFSETLGAFWMAVLVVLIAQLERRLRVPLLFGVGLLASTLVLTCPATAFLAAAVVIAAAWRARHRPLFLLPLAIGLCIPMIPWQIHQRNATGHYVPQVYDFIRFRVNSLQGISRWRRSWLIWPQHVFSGLCYRGAKYFDDNVPDAAFTSIEERNRIRALCIAQSRGDYPLSSLDADFKELGDARYRDSPVWCALVLPIVRSITVWLQLEDQPPAQLSYIRTLSISNIRQNITSVGPLRTFARIIKAIYSALVLSVNCLFAMLFLYLLIRSCAAGNVFALAIVAGVVGYSMAGAIQGTHEVRRNVVFYPVMFYLFAYWRGRDTGREAGTSDPGLL